MTETARSWLSDLTSLYTPTPGQFDGARSHKASIEARLDTVIGVYRMFEIGSLSHGTGIWKYSDADFLVSLKGDKPSSPWTTLTNVKEALQQRFTSTSFAIRQPAVVCNFSDGVVEVVPGFISDSGYWIADPMGGNTISKATSDSDSPGSASSVWKAVCSPCSTKIRPSP